MIRIKWFVMFCLFLLVPATGVTDTDTNERIIGPLGLASTGYVYAGLETEQVLPLKKDLYHCE